MPYTTFYQFGKDLNSSVQNPSNAANPLTYCMLPTLSSQFTHGSTSAGKLYSNQNVSCSNFMAERCKEKWDDYCETYSLLNTDTYWPNLGVIDQLAFENAKQFWNMKTTVGQDLIRNTMYHRYICPRGQYITREPFDPNVANSPMINIYDNYIPYYSQVIRLENPETIQSDPHISKMLEYAKLCTDVLGRIYLGYLRKEPKIHIKGTILETFFKQNQSIMDTYIKQAIQYVPSFQIENQPSYPYG